MTVQDIGGPPAVHSIDHVALSVPSLDEARAFYEAFGLEVRETGDGLGVYTAGDAAPWVVLGKGSRKQLRYVCFNFYPEDLERFRARFEELSIPIIQPPANAPQDGLWIESLDGVPLQLRPGPKRTPDGKTQVDIRSAPGGQVGTVSRSKAPKVQPNRLSHVAVFTRDVSASIAFFEKAIGLRLSDQSGGAVAFLHTPHGSDHHLLALIVSEGPGLHHFSWDVDTVQEVGLGAAQLAQHGYTSGWGVGRHVLGSNFFYYARDPWGSYSEYSADIDYIPAGMDWKAGDHDPADSMFLWGPTPPEDFIKNTEVTA